MTKISMTKTNKPMPPHQGSFVLNFEHLNFDIVSDFVFRASDFPFS
jgi:hypothetical protein